MEVDPPERTASFVDLPHDLVHKILSFVYQKHKDAVMPCLKVCRDWRRIMLSCVEKVVNDGNDNVLAFARSLPFHEARSIRIWKQERSRIIHWRDVVRALAQNCPKIENLDIDDASLVGSVQLNCIAEAFPGLRSLVLNQTFRFSALPPPEGLHCLEELRICSNKSLNDLSTLTYFTSLHSLELRLEVLHKMPEWGPLVNLESFILHLHPKGECHRVRDLVLNLQGLRLLRKVHVVDQTECIQSILGLETALLLNDLDLSNTSIVLSPGDVMAFRRMAFLQVLTLHLHPNPLGILPSLGPGLLLDSLTLTISANATDHCTWESPTAQRMDLQHEDLQTLPWLHYPHEVRELVLRSSPRLQSLQAATAFTYLKKLEVDSCKRLWELPELAGLARLQHLEIVHCHGLLHLPALPSSLQVLKLNNCTKLCSFPSLSHLSQLRRMEIHYCGSKVKVPPSHELPKVREFSLDKAYAHNLRPLLSNPGWDVKVCGLGFYAMSLS